MVALASTYFLRRWYRRRWTTALLGVTLALDVLLAGTLGAAAASLIEVCLFDGCSDRPTLERLGGTVIVWEWLLLLLVAAIAFIAALAVALTGRDLRSHS